MDPNATGFPMLQQQQQQHTGFPVTSQSPQQFPYYANAMPSFPQQKTTAHLPQQHSFGAMPMQPGAPGGAMMPSAFPQHSSAPHPNFSAPYTQPPVSATMNQFMPPQTTAPSTPAATLPPTATPSYPQNMASLSNNMVQPQPQRPAPQPNPPQASAPPMTPAAVAREKARVTVLLDINSMLLQEVVNLQEAGKAGGPPSQPPENNPSSDQPPAPEPPRGPTQKPSPEYFDCMRRLQANLAYLATIADRAKKSGGVPPSAPQIMTPPPHTSSMNEIYKKLVELFPRTGPGAGPQPNLQNAQGNGKPSPSPATETVV
ncbi:hypothetical protein BDV25DRAFT_152117 [Aspergillus avenaceus]|uniref:Glutamine repeat protein-1 n=1 Tax=Aspergillus avenaceus TaxID=36643 RepID=A0A5N6U094_ASPAV|nr:hypothetical protein BDV25DRAFT_152117 [Aspergillus avenaceus]